jgi:hypothetical protein
MKLKSYIIAFSTLILFTVGGCKKELDINTDPNNAADVDVNLLLPSAEAAIAFALGNNLQITGGIWSQYWTQNPSSSQYRSLEQYSPSPSSFDNVWITLNSDALEDLQRIIDKAQAKNLFQYEAVATLLKAYTMQLSTDLFGDIPYTEALKGDKGILNPRYDPQQVVYDSLFVLVDKGLSLIDPNDPNHPGNDDLIYQGDMELWYHFGTTLKLKLALRLSQVDAPKAAAVIATLEGEDFLQSGETALINYSATGGNQNPLYSAIAGPVLSGTQNLVASSTSINFFNTNNDPRVEVFYNPTGGNFIGIKQGDYSSVPPGTAVSIPSAIVGADALDEESALAPVKFMTDYEAKFLQAEAVARGWLSGGDAVAAELYQAGIEDNFTAYGLEDEFAAYAAQPAVAFPSGGSIAQKIGAIITQKWAAMNGTQGIESWTEWRRTGYPSFFTPSAASIIGTGRIPQIFLYPTAETTRNRNTPPQHQVYDRVWWDVN